ncbi:MAG: MBL fold metallo-hydrolase [Dysgonamonadaceae bacterium]|jgi:phosphoribosyl 1,2-cyclic phosphodiesterase|nr:MBL fold metallo-hydrolase [Dysgonamonadaceae bacterium]
MQYELFSSERYSFFSLGSGSCGNSYYLGNSCYGILIDAGIGPRIMKKRLAEHGIDFSFVRAVLVTHDHLDHIKSVGYLAEKMHIPIYGTREVHRGITKNPYVRNSLNGSRQYIEKGIMFKIGGLKITAFDIPHDSVDSVGYFIEFGNGHKLMLATDVGTVTDKLGEYIRKANHVVIESNYDEEMLKNGKYPYFLKQRITSGTGHLSNREIAEFLCENYESHHQNIWLCHLSGDNNYPELAYKTMETHLTRKGVKVGVEVNLRVLERNKLSEKILF